MKVFGIIATIVAVAAGVYFVVSSMAAPSSPPVDIPDIPNNGSTSVVDTPNEPPEDVTWISPGKVMVANFYPGAQAEYPLQVHNGNSDWVDIRDLTHVVTDVGQISYMLYLEESIMGLEMEVYSDNPEDRPTVNAVFAETNEIVVAGLEPDSNRVLTTDYQTGYTFEVKYRVPDHVDEGYVKSTGVQEDWIIIADMTPVFEPRETRDIMVTLVMPEDAEPPGDKWEFWVSVIDVTKQTMVMTEMCSRWLIVMQ